MKIKRIRYSRKKFFVGLFLLLFLFGIGIGYAYINTDLEILGIAKVKDARWDVHFDNYNVVTGSVVPATNPTITDTTMSFSASLTDPGDYYEFTIDVENEGTINAILSSFSVSPDFSLVDYINSSITYSDGSSIQVGDVLRTNKTKTIKVKLTYIDGINESLYPSTNQTFNVTVSLGYSQYMNSISSFTLPQGKTVNTLSLGDELCLDDQCFNFIKYDGDNVVMLAKWNLKVGDIYNDNGEKTGEYTSNDEGYGLQSSEVIGINQSSTYYGTVPFSATKYWTGAASYPTEVYDATYVTEPDFSTTCNNTDNCWKTPGYSIAYYVEGYKTKLTNDYHAIIKSARLLTYDEATDSDIGCNISDSTCPTIGPSGFIRNTSFWLGSAFNAYNVWRVYSSDTFSYSNYVVDYSFGVRPVIIVEKNNL